MIKNLIIFLIPLDVIHFLNKAIWDSNKTDILDSKKIARFWDMMMKMENSDSCKVRKIDKIPNEVIYAKNILSQISSLDNLKRKFKQLKHNLENQGYEKENKSLIRFYIVEIKRLEKKSTDLASKVNEMIEGMWFEEEKQNLQSFPWIGEKISSVLTVFFIDLMYKWFTKKDWKKVRKYSWLCPINWESGKSLNKSKIDKRWNKLVRYYLLFTAMIWRRNLKLERFGKTHIWKFWKRMETKFETNRKGKKGWMSISCALGSKIICVLWAMFCDNVEYNTI